MQLIAVCTYYF